MKFLSPRSHYSKTSQPVMALRNLIIFLIVLAMSLTSPIAIHAGPVGSKDTIDDYLSALEASPNDKELLRTVAFYYMSIGDRIGAKEYGERLISLGEVTGDRDFCRLYGLIVVSSTIIDDNAADGFRLLEEARLIAENTGNHDALLSINNSLGMYYMFIHNDIYTATSYYYKALEEAKAINDERRYGIILSNLSGAYLMMNDVSGQKLAEQSYEIAMKRGDPVPQYYAAATLIHFYLLSDSLAPVPGLIDMTERLHREGGFGGEPNHYICRARLAEKQGDRAGAYRNYALAMENFKNSDASDIAATYLAYAGLLRRDNNVPAALRVLEYGFDNLKSSEMKLHLPEIMKELVYAYRDAGDYKKALEYSLDYQSFQDSIFKLSRERALQENRISHEVYANERLIDEQKTELTSARYRATILAVVVVAILLLLGLTYYNYRKKDGLYRAIVQQNRQYLSHEQMLLEQLELAKKQKPATGGGTALPEDKAGDLMARFTAAMTGDKLFTDPSITVGAVAEKLGTNRTYLSKAINESTGKTFTQVINDYRIREAISLISDLEANMPLKQICAEVGFSSLSTFYTTFQATTGMTPARYRTQLKEM